MSTIRLYGIDEIWRYSYILQVVSLAAGIWGIIRSVKGLMVTILRSDSVVDSWNRVVEEGAGKGDYVLGTVESMIIDAHMPGVATRKENVAIELFGEKRPFLIVQNLRHKEYKMYINARDFGHCSADSEIAIDRAGDRFYPTGPNLLLLRRVHHVRTG